MEPSVDPRELRRLILYESYRAHVGHIGSSLSIADIIAVLLGDVLRGVGTTDPSRDLFILSKGHAALALYAGLHLRGILNAEQLDSYCGDGSLLAVHPESDLVGVDFSTGSLGLGLSYGAGSAYAARLRGLSNRTFVLLSDAELNEGSVWEAAMFSASHHLDNLIAIVDENGQQALGRTRDVIDLSPLHQRWEAFGWRVFETDGHDVEALRSTLFEACDPRSSPTVVIARTKSGSGVSFMEQRIEWHYLPLDEAKYRQAIEEVGA